MTLLQLPELEYTLSNVKSPMLGDMRKNFDLLEDVCDLLERAIMTNRRHFCVTAML